MPEVIAPQLATLAEAPPEGDEWLHEIKFDGYRLLARIEGGDVRLITRNRLDWTAKFPELARALAALPVESALIDGEVVALAPDGTSSFGALQDVLSRGDTAGLVFYAFDLLYRDDYDLTGAALEDRKAALAAIVAPQVNRKGTVQRSPDRAWPSSFCGMPANTNSKARSRNAATGRTGPGAAPIGSRSNAIAAMSSS